MSQNSDVIKYEGDNSMLVWKYPCESINSIKQLIVYEAQEAILFVNGQIFEVFGPGKHLIDNNLKMGENINETISDTSLNCEVYFINKTVQMPFKWGTDSRVRFIDQEYGVPLEIGASGSLNIQVADSKKFLVKFVGTMNDLSEKMDCEGFNKSIVNFFRPLVSTEVKANLTPIIKSLGINILEIDEHLAEVGRELHKKINRGFEEYGLILPQFYLSTIVLPEEDRNFKRIKELHTVALQRRMIFSETDIKMAKAQSEAEITAAQRELELERQKTETEIVKYRAERKIIEAQAEAKINREIDLSGQFNQSTCPKCGARLHKNAKFCLECGEKITEKLYIKMMACPTYGKTECK